MSTTRGGTSPSTPPRLVRKLIDPTALDLAQCSMAQVSYAMGFSRVTVPVVKPAARYSASSPQFVSEIVYQ